MLNSFVYLNADAIALSTLALRRELRAGPMHLKPFKPAEQEERVSSEHCLSKKTVFILQGTSQHIVSNGRTFGSVELSGPTLQYFQRRSLFKESYEFE